MKFGIFILGSRGETYEMKGMTSGEDTSKQGVCVLSYTTAFKYSVFIYVTISFMSSLYMIIDRLIFVCLSVCMPVIFDYTRDSFS